MFLKYSSCVNAGVEKKRMFLQNWYHSIMFQNQLTFSIAVIFSKISSLSLFKYRYSFFQYFLSFCNYLVILQKGRNTIQISSLRWKRVETLMDKDKNRLCWAGVNKSTDLKILSFIGTQNAWWHFRVFTLFKVEIE